MGARCEVAGLARVEVFGVGACARCGLHACEGRSCKSERVRTGVRKGVLVKAFDARVGGSASVRVWGVRAAHGPFVSTCRQDTYSLDLMNGIGRRGVGWIVSDSSVWVSD